MSRRALGRVAILATAAAALVAGQAYGPSRRVVASPARVVGAPTPEDVGRLWAGAGVRGRVAVLFTRRLNAVAPDAAPASSRYLEEALDRGLVREVFHVVPDQAWAGVSRTIESGHGFHRTTAGFVLYFDGGRVNLMPLSRFPGVAERSLVVVEPAVWSAEERARIARQVAVGAPAADLLAVVRGGSADLALFGEAVVAGAGR